MVKRRKFLIGLGAVAAGSAAAVGTGAFSSAAMPDRKVTVAIDDDANSQIGLVPGDDPDVTIGGDGQLRLDLEGADGEGVNINSVYTWGDHDSPSDDYAFKIVNNDDQDYDDVVLTYGLDDDSWVDNSTTYNNESFIRFTAYGSGDPDGYWGSMKCPNNQLGTPNPVSRNLPTSGPVDFEVGQELYIVVDVDTTGVDATMDDELAGALTVEVGDIS
ncbi:MAG TPA: hypothetical protein VJ898_06800 [Natrialbaceae archaeon]|nr:hypothetical protein [Natrialbaceae archaeon]